MFCCEINLSGVLSLSLNRAEKSVHSAEKRVQKVISNVRFKAYCDLFFNLSKNFIIWLFPT